MKQFDFHNNILHLKIKKSPLLIQLVLFSLTIVTVLLPLTAIGLAISDGSGFKFIYLISIGLFSLMGFYLLRVSLWNTYGEEIIDITEAKITYVANYGWFKDGKRELLFGAQTYSIKQIGYKEENIGILVIDSDGGTIESVVKISIPELQELINILETISSKGSMSYLFSYGTLQKEQVQLETFGRKLIGEKDSLLGYDLKMVEITDAEVLRKSGEKYHPIIEYTGNVENKIKGILFKVTEEEILQADRYEVDDYKRIEVEFESGRKGFIYVKK